MSEKFVYLFGEGKAEGNKDMRDLLGGKGANLAEMCNIDLPVPPGFTISAKACESFHSDKDETFSILMRQIEEGIAFLEKTMGQKFGDQSNPLLLSVRSGAAISMPGMMDTVLNLGMNPQVTEGLAQKTKNPRFAWDSYRRFVDMYGNVVMGIPHEKFEDAITDLKNQRGVESDADLEAQDFQDLVVLYLSIYKEHTKEEFPSDPKEQLIRSVEAVFESWNGDRAVKYREIHRITDLLGTAVNVQSMVFGNMGQDCATGVCFTRNPATGENSLFGEFLTNAQGEDVVAGIRTPMPICDLKKTMPVCFEQLLRHTQTLERHYKDMQDIEFTIQQSKLFILQTRRGKRSGGSAIKIACDMVDEGLVDAEHAVANLVEPDHLDQLLHPQFKENGNDPLNVIATGLPASPGAAVGKVVFHADDAEKKILGEVPTILVRLETSPEDVGGMHVAEGILTARGGMTSHAAVVARGWGKCCVVGCEKIHVDARNNFFTVGERKIEEGDWISLNGTTGEVILGKKELVKPGFGGDFAKFMGWVDRFREMGVRTNADTPEDARLAVEFGAEGIGLCRTEHMFFESTRILLFREMIMADDEKSRQKILDRLLPYQKEDFKGLFLAMKGRPVTIRLLDPPLHEFLPKEENEILSVAMDLKIDPERIREKLVDMAEVNPMMGLRGCRLGIDFPEITATQARAIFLAAVEVQKEGLAVEPEIMVPLVGSVEEFLHQKNLICKIARQVFDETQTKVPFKVGTMIEIPRAALIADEIARHADFFSFGTNDLTQMTYGFSRDDSVKFLSEYIRHKILPVDPFQVLDQKGVGQLVKMAFEKGRSSNPNLIAGICGEHGGEPSSVRFCYKTGLNYVSCSPYRVPIARLAAAQAAIAEKKLS